MSDTAAPSGASSPPAPAGRVRKRLWIPLAVLAALCLVLAVLVWRGTQADTTPRFPSTADEGTLTHLYQRPDGAVEVRCSIIVPAAPAKIWGVVTDYGRHAEFLPYVSQMSAKPAAEGKVRVTGVAHSRLWGDFPFESDVRHEPQADKGIYTASWDQEVGGFVNQGGWLVTPHGAGQTMVTYRLRAEVDPYPNWLIRNILMDRLHSVLRGLRDEVQKRP